MKTTPCPNCGHPLNPAAMLANLKTPEQKAAAKINGALGGRPVGAKDSKPRKPRTPRDKGQQLGPGNRPNILIGSLVTLKYGLNPEIQAGHTAIYGGCRKHSKSVSGYRVTVNLTGANGRKCDLDAHHLNEYQP